MTETEAQKKVLVVLGSFRRQSFSRSIARYATSVLSQTYKVEVAPTGELPLFNQDYDDDGTTPESWKAFRAQVAESDAILFVTPEHNRSFPAVMKNALDIASRPAGQSVWGKKPAAVISVSMSRMGGALCNQHLRQPLTVLDMYVMTQPEMYIGDVTELLDAEGVLKDESTKRHLDKFVAAFEKWVTLHTT